MLDYTPLVAALRASSSPLLMTHVRPDADGLGSQLAVAEALRSLGKVPRVVIASPLPPRYEFLDPGRSVVRQFRPDDAELAACDLILILDTGTWNQIGDFGAYLRSRDVPKFVLDHHRTQDDLGGTALVDAGAEATGRLAYELIQALGVPVTAPMANHLLMAVALDTGWFRHPNTTAESFGLAQALVGAGAGPTRLYEQLFECASLGRLRLLGVALARMQLRAGGAIAFTEVYLSDYAESGAVPGDTEDLVNYPRAIEGVEVALIFMEQAGGGVKISLRARSRVDVSKLAERFNGGGHRLASGARANGTVPDVREAVIAAAEAALAESAPAGVPS